MRANPEWHAEARALRDAGIALDEIAHQFRKSIASVSRATKGCAGRKRRQYKDQWSPIADAFILESYGPKSASKIGRELGVSRNAIIGRVFRLRHRASEDA